MTEISTPPRIRTIGDNMKVAEGLDEEVEPVTERIVEVAPLMFFFSWLSFEKRDLVFESIFPECGSAPFRIITENNHGLEPSVKLGD